MNILEAILLGLMQGLTEFLPVSSSGHIEIGKSLLNIHSSNNLLFSVVVHAATALSTIVVYRKDIGDIIKGLLEFKLNDATSFSFKILLSMIPLLFIGLFLAEEIEALFEGKILVVGFMLIITGFFLSVTYYSPPKSGSISYGRSILIGIAQTIAILPGISRSGATIATALMLGVDKEKATQFSFLMVLIPIIGAAFLKLLDYFNNPVLNDSIDIGSLIAGFFAAFIAGLFACKWMIKIVRKGKLIYFAFYCFTIGILSIILSL
jgi:undecaprenyl-diphosphatase